MLQSRPGDARRDRVVIATASSVAVPAGLTLLLLGVYLTSSYARPSGIMLVGIVSGVVIMVGIVLYCRLTHALGEIERLRDQLDSDRKRQIMEIIGDDSNVTALHRD